MKARTISGVSSGLLGSSTNFGSSPRASTAGIPHLIWERPLRSVSVLDGGYTDQRTDLRLRIMPPNVPVQRPLAGVLARGRHRPVLHRASSPAAMHFIIPGSL